MSIQLILQPNLTENNSLKKKEHLILTGKCYFVESLLGSGVTSEVFKIVENNVHNCHERHLNEVGMMENINANEINMKFNLQQLKTSSSIFEFRSPIVNSCKENELERESSKLSSVYAIKVVQHKYLTSAINESKILSILNHPSLVHLHEVDHTFLNDKVILMIDHCPNGDLTDLVQLVERMGKLRAMRTEIYLHAMAQIVSVLEYLHLQGVQHRDVKRENFVMDQLYRVKIIDFGSANISNDKLLRTMKVNSKLGRLAEIIEKFENCPEIDENMLVGSPHYLSPETIRSNFKGNNSSQSLEQCDIWALGVLIYTLFARCYPFEGVNNFELVNEILNKEPNYYLIENDEIREMVSMLLNKDPTKRMNLQQIKALPLFKGVDFETISEIESPIVKLLENHKKEYLFEKEMLVRSETGFHRRKVSIVEKNKGLKVKPKLLKETSLFTSLEMDKGVESECLPLPTMVTSLDAVGRECQSYIVISTAQSDTQPKKYSRRSILLQGNFKFDMVDDEVQVIIGKEAMIEQLAFKADRETLTEFIRICRSTLTNTLLSPSN